MSDKKSKLIELDIHRRKLSLLVGELLKKADEIDQLTKHKPTKLSADWHERMASTCGDLAALNETVIEIDVLLKASKVAESETTILRSVKIADHLARRLRELKQEAE